MHRTKGAAGTTVLETSAAAGVAGAARAAALEQLSHLDCLPALFFAVTWCLSRVGGIKQTNVFPFGRRSPGRCQDAFNCRLT